MVVDCILDRKDGSPYNPREFYQDMLAYEADDISRAMDEGTEEDVKKALCDYIKFNDYNPAICDYINSVNWLTSSNRRTKMNKKSIKSAHQDKMWRGVPGVEMIWHGEWSDPELEYEGNRRNYWDVEDAMYEWAKEDGIDTENDEEFNRYCQEHAYDVYECFSSCGKKKGKKKPVKSNRRPIQSMYVTQDISGNDLYTCLWSGGKDQFDSMIEDGADADDILNACEELLFREEGNPPTMTELNDLIWFEPDTIREYIGLSNPIESGCHGKSKKKKTDKSVKSEWVVRCPDRTNLSGYSHRKFNTEEEARKFAEGKDNCEVYEQRDYNTPRLENYGWKKTVKSSMPGRERGIQAIMDEYGCTREEAIEIMNEEIQNSRKPVKSAYNPYSGEGEFFVNIDVVEDGEHSSPKFSNDVMWLDDFIQECKDYAESCNGYYHVSDNGTNQYLIEFKTGDDSFTDNPGTDPYYEESCGKVVVELIYPYNQEMADYIENGGY